MTAKSEISSEQATSVMAHEKPLQVLLMDDAVDFTHVQRELLAVAHVLRSANFVVHILCLEKSRLMECALAEEFKVVALPQKNAGFFATFFSTLKLLWKYDKKSPCCIHAFSCTCLPLLQSFVSRRLIGTTISLYSHFNPREVASALVAEPLSRADISKKEMAKMPRIPDMPKIQPVKPTLSSEETSNAQPTKNNSLSELINQLSIVSKIIVPSAHWRHQFAEGAVDVSRLQIIHSACPKDELSPQKLQKERFVFILPAVLKGDPEHDCMDMVLKSMLKLKKSNPELTQWEVRVVANEQQVASYVQKANALEIADHLTLLTGVDSDFPLQEVLQYAGAIILLESQPEVDVTSVMTAWCLGVPIIATHVPGHVELLEVADKIRFSSKGQAKNDQMQFFDIDDVDSLTKSMKELLSAPKRCAALAKASLAMANYGDMSRLTQNYLDIYKNCIASKGWVLPK